ncbi:tyrosine-type recombinase/integrase [Candidatus Woesearchaeota archaeon]|nr:tyrosine-type recombinase/integrase [Candidatus Woesearchaeota archaeon]
MVYIPVDIEKSVAKECKRRNYSEKTIKSYIYCINRFLKYTNKSLDKISKKDVRLFLEHLSEKSMAGNTMNLYHMAIRFLFEDVLDKRIWIDIKYSKTPERIPVVLSKEEIKSLFNAIKNQKHKLMIQLMYSAGLRVSELINLKADDLDINKGYGFVRKGKGNKDRIFIIADSIKEELRRFIGTKKLNEFDYLFTSKKGKKYNVSSPRNVIKKACKIAKIEKNISCHTLRHSFATHLIEYGYSISEVQSLLGHKSPETTFVYVHATSPNMIKVKSPLDNL